MSAARFIHGCQLVAYLLQPSPLLAVHPPSSTFLRYLRETLDQHPAHLLSTRFAPRYGAPPCVLACSHPLDDKPQQCQGVDCPTPRADTNCRATTTTTFFFSLSSLVFFPPVGYARIPGRKRRVQVALPDCSPSIDHPYISRNSLRGHGCSDPRTIVTEKIGQQRPSPHRSQIYLRRYYLLHELREREKLSVSTSGEKRRGRVNLPFSVSLLLTVSSLFVPLG